jgi:hypothetical protein
LRGLAALCVLFILITPAWGKYLSPALDHQNGRAVQVAPIRPTLKAPGTKRLKLQYDDTAFNFSFRIQLAPLHHDDDDEEPVAHTPRTSFTEVGRCRLTLSKSVLKGPMVSALEARVR